MAKNEDETRTLSIRVPVNKREYDAIKERAATCGWDMAPFLRWMGLAAHMPETVRVPKRNTK